VNQDVCESGDQALLIFTELQFMIKHQGLEKGEIKALFSRSKFLILIASASTHSIAVTTPCNFVHHNECT